MNTKSKLFLLPLLILLTLILSGCSDQRIRSEPTESEWGRGLSVGTGNMREAGAIALTPDAKALHLVWTQKGGAGIDLHYGLMDRDQGMQISQPLETGLFLPRSTRLFLTPDGGVHIFTLAKPSNSGQTGVFHIAVTAQGSAGAPAPVTPSNQVVEAYDAVMRPDGRITLAWESSPKTGGGISAFDLTFDGAEAISGGSVRVSSSGRGPQLEMDGDGVLHMLWYETDKVGSRQFFYDAFLDGEISAASGTMVAEHGSSDRIVFSEPVLGYDDDHIYVFWSREIVGGMGSGTATTAFAAFPKENPGEVASGDIRLPQERIGASIVHASNLAYIPLGRQTSGILSSFIIAPYPINSNTADLPVLLTVKSLYRMQEEAQPVMAVFADGELVGYEPFARTERFSYFPVGARAENGGVYVLWLDLRGGGNYDVYVAASDPAWKAASLKTTPQDISADVSEELSFGLLATVALIPIILILLLIPSAWIAILLLLGRGDDLHSRSGRIQFLIALTIYFIARTAAFAPSLASPPLLSTVPASWASLAVYLLPAIILAIAGIALGIYAWLADRAGMIMGFFVFAVVDVILSALIYGPAMYN